MVGMNGKLSVLNCAFLVKKRLPSRDVTCRLSGHGVFFSIYFTLTVNLGFITIEGKLIKNIWS